MSDKKPVRAQAARLLTSVRRGVAAVAACFMAAPVLSNPVNPVVVHGTASFNQVGNLLTVTNSNGAIINWDKFSIKAGETTHFAQTSASSAVMNRVLNDPSAIYGTLSSNGRVWLINPAGILVGPGGRIDTAGFVASTLNLSNADFLAGRKLFVNDGTAQNVVNQGEIRTPAGGSVYLIGSNVTNEGIITTPDGETILAAGVIVSLIDSATPGVKVDITGAAGNATNLGQITAEAGRIGIAGVIVRNSGILNASSVVEEGGRIFLRASQGLKLDASSVIRADAVRDGKGGNVLVWADETAEVDGSISARGGSASGDGGFIETSAHKLSIAATTRITTQAPHGKAGTWLLDPYDFNIAPSGGDITGLALSTALDSNDVTIQTDLGSASCTGASCGPGTSGGSGDILVNDGIAWSSSRGLTLSAYRNIQVNQPISSGVGSTLILRADNTGTGIGTALFDAPITTGAGGQTHLYYNPPNYGLPTDFSGWISGGHTAWMLVNGLGSEAEANTGLQGMAANLSGDYALGRNIDASATAEWNSLAGFVPVGAMTAFTGQFDGLGHTISNLRIGRPTTDHVGLFGVASGAVIKNLTLTGSSIVGRNYVGGLVGSLDGGSIAYSNSYSDLISGASGVGGLAGQIYGDALVSNSASDGNVSATDGQGNAGGLVGLLACCGSPTIQASYSSADVNGVGNLGGLVGWMQKGQINSSIAYGNVTGSGDNVGGLVGKAGQSDVSSPAEISNSSATGLVIGVSNIGGLVGENTGYSVVTGSDSSGTVTGSGNNIGGLVGNNAGSIVDSLTTTAGVSGVLDVGGLVGFNSDVGLVTNSHYNARHVSINGVFRVTEGARYTGQFTSWQTNSRTLDIGNYPELPLNAGYHEISSVAGLRDLLGFASTPGLKFRLTANIDLAAVTDGLHIPHFAALELDGAGHVVTSFNLSLPNNHAGFIGRLDAGTVKNIGIVGGSVSGEGGVAGLVGLNKGGTVNNAYSTATITGGNGYDIGGLVGFNSGGTVSDSHSSANVTGGGGSTRTGGLVGANFGTIIDSHATGTVSGWREVGGLAGGSGGTISNSYATGPVSGTGTDVGGLVGHVWYGSISDSYATGNVGSSDLYTGGLIGYAGYNNGEGVVFTPSVTRTYATGAVTNTHGGYSYAGGLIGANEGTVANSYATGAVNGNSGVGGLAGLSLRMGSVAESYATGAVSGNIDVGGLIGENRAPVQNSYATGAASGTDRVGGLAGWNSSAIDTSYATGLVTSGGASVGGLVGVDSGGTVSNSFWDIDTTGKSTTAGGGTGLSTADMKTAATFTGAGWSDAYWNIADGAYPTLKNMPLVVACIGYDNCWIGAIDSLWATAGNWTAGVPGGSQTVKIDVAGTPTISLAGVNPSFGSLWLAENLDVDAGVTFTLTNLFTLNAGTATFDGNASVHSYAQTGGTLAGSGLFTVTNSFSKTAGAIDRTGPMTVIQAAGALDFAATHVGGLSLDASTINLGPVTSGNQLTLTADTLHVNAAVSSASTFFITKSYTDITLGRNDVPGSLGLLQSDLDRLTTGYIYMFANRVTVDSGSPTVPVTFAHVADYLYPSVDQVAINSPLTLSMPGTALYVGARRIDINAALTVGAGGVFLGKNASNVAYLVGVGTKTYPANTVELTNTELNRIVTTGPVTIGDPYNAYNVIHGPMQIVGPIDLTGIGSQLRLVGDGVTQAAGATITAPQLAVDGYGSINLPEANHVGTFAAKSSNGSVAFVNDGPLTIGKVATTASPYYFSTEGLIAGGGSASVTANGALTLSAGAGQTTTVSGTDVWLTFNGDLSLNAGAGGQAYVEASSAPTIHLDFSSSAGQVKFNGSVATDVTNGLAGPGTPNFIGFWNAGVAAVPGSTLLLTNTSFSFGGPTCVGYDNCWTGAVNSLWATAGNWTAGHAPTGSESAKVDVAGTPTISVLGVNPSFGSLWLAENLNVDAGVSFTLGNLFTLNAGTAAFNGAASVQGYSQTGGTLAGSGAFTVTNAFTRTGGNIDRSGSMDITQATGNLAFSATNVGALKLRAGSGDISLGAVTAGNDLFAAAGRGLTVSARIRSEGKIALASGATHDGTAYSASGYGGNIVLASGSELSAGDGVTYNGKDITVIALAGSAARGSITQNTGSTVGGDTVSFHGAGSVTLNGSVTAVNYSPAALNVLAGTDYLAPSTRTQYGGDVLIGGSLDAQNVNLTANGGLSGGANIVQAAPSVITVRGGQMTATSYGDALLNGTMVAHDAPVTIVAGYDTIGTADVAGKNVSLGRIEAAGAYITATGAILDGNGSATNIIATWLGGPVIQLRSKGGGSAGSLAISADTATGGTITATVDSGATYGGIDLRNTSLVQPTSVDLTDNATSGSAIFSQNFTSPTATLSDAGIALVARPGGFVGLSSNRDLSFGGTGFFTAGGGGQIGFAANNGILSIDSVLAGGTDSVELSAGTLNIAQPVSGVNITLDGSTMNVNAATTATGLLDVFGGTVNVNAAMQGQNVFLGANTLNIGKLGGTGGINATNHMLAVVTGDTNITGGYLTTVGGDLELLVGGDLKVGNASHGGMIHAGMTKMTPYFPDASIAVGGKLKLTNGGYIAAANDIYLDLLGSASTLEMSAGGGSPAYILADAGIGVSGTTFVTFATRSSGGIFIDGKETTENGVGASGFFSPNLSTPGGVEVAYAQANDGSAAAQLVNALSKAVEAVEIEDDGFTPKSGKPDKDKKAACSEGSFGCEDEQTNDGKKEEKPGQKKVAQCGM